MRDFGPDQRRLGVLSAQMTQAAMISARISVFASATAAAARVIRTCTNPGGGRAQSQRLDELCGPVHREAVGIRNRHQACTCTL